MNPNSTIFQLQTITTDTLIGIIPNPINQLLPNGITVQSARRNHKNIP